MSAKEYQTSILGRPGRNETLLRPLTVNDDAAVQQLYDRFPLRTLTLRLNVEAHGLSGPVVRAWGLFDGHDAAMTGMLIRYGNTAVVVDSDGSGAVEFARLIDSERNIAGVRGSLEVVAGIQALLQRYVVTDWENSYFLALRTPPTIPAEVRCLARRAVPGDLDMLAELYSGAGAMYRSRANVAAKLRETRVFVVEEPPIDQRKARIASCALLNVEGRDAGLIGGVYTLPSVRGKGYAAACTALLSADLQRDGKMPCLFYENPIAGKVYRRLGFEDVSKWGVLYLSGNGGKEGA